MSSVGAISINTAIEVIQKSHVSTDFRPHVNICALSLSPNLRYKIDLMSTPEIQRRLLGSKPITSREVKFTVTAMRILTEFNFEMILPPIATPGKFFQLIRSITIDLKRIPSFPKIPEKTLERMAREIQDFGGRL
ncbi:MAG: hypothetical protein HQ564_08915 [Candidatus Saganbacteria bacterium]|nr:hypothetical protein [Candidatus Saganbacteria bacterium]